MRIPKIGDVWLVEFPYATPGNVKKTRPAIIKDFIYGEDRDSILVQKLTSKKHKNYKQFNNQKMNKTTYISYETAVIEEYHLIRYLCKYEDDRERVIK